MELIRVENGTALLNPETSARIADFETQVKMLKEAEEALKGQILAEMEMQGISKVETPELIITYIAEQDRETFDSKEFRNDHSDLYDQYIRMTKVKPSIRIKVR